MPLPTSIVYLTYILVQATEENKDMLLDTPKTSTTGKVSTRSMSIGSLEVDSSVLGGHADVILS